MTHRIVKWLVPLGVLVLAAIGADGPWPPM